MNTCILITNHFYVFQLYESDPFYLFPKTNSTFIILKFIDINNVIV